MHSDIFATATANTPDVIIGECSVCTIDAFASEPSKPKTFHSNVYTGGILATTAYPKGIVIDLAGVQPVKRIIANLDHVKTARVGHITAIQNDGKTLEVDGVFSAATPAREEVIASSNDGFEWQTSVEMRPKVIENIAAGKTVEVNGRTFNGPIPIARETSFYGLAFVGQGADENTSAKIAAIAENNFPKGKTVNEFEKWIEANGFEFSALTDKQKAALQKNYDAEIKASADAGNKEYKPMIAKFDIDELKAAYAGHEATIEAEIFKAAGVVPSEKLSAIKASAFQGAVELKLKAVENEWSAMQFNLEAMQNMSEMQVKLIRSERPQGPAIHSSSRDVNSKVIEASFAKTRGTLDEKEYDEKTLESAHKIFKNGIGLQQLVIMAAAANGMHFHPGEGLTRGNLNEAFQHAFNPVMAVGVSTISVPGILSNIANKEILQGYNEEDQTWREISAIKPVSDFKQVTSYRMLDNMVFEKLGPAGEIRHGLISEETYTRQAETYAKMAALTRKDIINDDLGAFDDMRNRIGRGGAQQLNRVFWTAFLNNASFFTAGRGNFISGATTNLLTDGVGLQLGLIAFRKLKSPVTDGSKRVSANTIGGRPEILLLPPELESVGDKLYVGSNLSIGSAAGEENTHRNKYRPVICPWLSDTDFSGNSTTAWHLLRNPSTMPAVIVSFLNGAQTPTVESAAADFNTLGVQFRGYFDFGCDLAEYLCGIKSKGAA